MLSQRAAAHCLARFALTDFYHVTARWLAAKVVVKADDAQHVCARQVEFLGQLRDERVADEAVAFDKRV